MWQFFNEVMDVDSSKEAKLNDSEDSKSNQTENSSLNPAMSMYYLRSFPKRDRLIYVSV